MSVRKPAHRTPKKPATTRHQAHVRHRRDAPVRVFDRKTYELLGHVAATLDRVARMFDDLTPGEAVRLVMTPGAVTEQPVTRPRKRKVNPVP